MIMASNPQEHLQRGSLYRETVIHLQRLVLLNADSRDAYRAASILAKDARLISLAEHAQLERQIQAVTLQNILWGDGHESISRVCIESGDYGILDHVTTPPETTLTAIIEGLLDIDDYIYSCYKKIIGTIQGRGIRQLLSEQATRIHELRTALAELLRIIKLQNPSAESVTPTTGSLEL